MVSLPANWRQCFLLVGLVLNSFGYSTMSAFGKLHCNIGMDSTVLLDKLEHP